MILAWLLSILGIAVIGTLVELILPTHRISKFIKSVFRTMVVLVIILPLPGLFRNGFDFMGDGSIFDNNVNLDENFLQFMDNLRMRNLAMGAERQLQEEGITGIQIDITGRWRNNNVEISLVTVNVSNIVMSDELMNININEHMRTRLSELLFVDRTLIIII
ncbi:MAG: stage III sporulation protein AF [Firmicutes bacterium]|nr:stage III sporulation protein AF [Bacillota bacterium]MCL2255867.1 stage III sporulation protein AF [Bacillota bacterium]